MSSRQISILSGLATGNRGLTSATSQEVSEQMFKAEQGAWSLTPSLHPLILLSCTQFA